MTLAMGAVLSTSTITAVLTRCSSKKKFSLSGPLQFFDEEQFQIISAIVDRIIPKTDTPGAIEVKVPEFIDMMLSECYEKADQEKFSNGLTSIEESAENETGDSITELKMVKLEGFLTEFESQALSEDESSDQFFFMKTLKELSLLGYFTSKEGATEALRYVPVPGKFEPCIKMEDERSWALQ